MSELVFVVDDVIDNRILLSAMLTTNGFVCQNFSSGDDILKVLESRTPDLILLDVMMPDRDGFEVCRIIKEDERIRDIPVIFISARDDSDAILKGFAAGGTDYVSKPFHMQELLARINVHIQLKKSQIALKSHNKRLKEEVKRRTAHLEKTLKEKEVLIREVYHRVKNNLTLIDSIVSMEAAGIEDKEFSEILKKIKARVIAISRVHQTICESENFTEISANLFVSEIFGYLKKTCLPDNCICREILECNNCMVSFEQSVPLGIIINELVMNVFQNVKNSNDTIEIQVSLKKESGQMILCIKDNGPGTELEERQSGNNSLGFLFVSALVNQLNGSLDVTDGDGSEITVQFPVHSEPVRLV